jgi:hypothetical protein
MKNLKRFNENLYRSKFIYNSDWNLDFFNERDIKMINGEEYELSDVTKEDYKGWKIIGGKMKEEEVVMQYAIAISPREYSQLNNLNK